MALFQRNEIWHWRKMINGQTLNRSTKTSDEKLAKEMVRKWEHEAVQTIVFDGEKSVSVHEAIKQFLASRKNLSSYPNVCAQMKWWKQLPDTPMKSVKVPDLLAIVAKRREAGAAHNVITVMIAYWNAVINFCLENKLSAGPKLPTQAPQATRIRFLTEAEEAAIYGALEVPASYPGKCPKIDADRQANQDLMVCLLHLGARVREAETLAWSDVDFLNNTVYVRRLKGGNPCLLLMSSKLRAVMERRRAAEPLATHVFMTKYDHVTNKEWVNKAVQRAGINLQAGKVTSHTMRHTAATWLLRSGMSIIEVQRFLGHKSINSTLVYLHAVPGEVAKKAQAVFGA